MSSFNSEDASGRLRRLRIQAGYATAADAARAMKTNVVTYQHHENGRRAISRAAAEEYGRFFSVAAGLILYGEALQAAQRIALMGAVQSGGVVVQDVEGHRGFVQGPPTDRDLVGLRVETDDLYPAYRRGDLVFYERPGPLAPDLASLNGRDCVVTTEDGRTLLRLLTHNGDDRATLVAFAGPPILNVKIVSACPVIWLHRAEMLSSAAE
jgi:hypothetical protein